MSATLQPDHPHAPLGLPPDDDHPQLPKKKRRNKDQEAKILRWGCELYDYYRDFYAPYREKMSNEAQMILDQRHYNRDLGNTFDIRRQQYKGNQVAGLIEHKVGKLTASEMFFDVRPGEPDALPMDCAIGRAILEAEIYDELKCWDDCIDACATAGFVARAGYIFIDYDETVGRGEILPGFEDPRNVMITPGCLFAHDPRTPILIRRKRIAVATIHAMKDCGWINTEDVKPDTDPDMPEPDNRSDAWGNVDLSPGGVSNDQIPVKGMATVAFIYSRDDHFCQRESEMTGMRPLAPKDRYHFCPPGNGGCGLTMSNGGDGSDLDEWGPICPKCGAQMERADAEEDWAEQGRMHCGVVNIICPDQRVYLGWREMDEPTFPCIHFMPRPDFRRSVGQSETSRNWSYQIAHDMLMTSAITQARLNVDRIFVVKDSVYDEHGHAYSFDDQQGRVGVVKNLGALQSIKHIQGSGIANGWNVIEARVDSALRGDLGSSDINTRIGMDRTKDIPVGTIQAMVAEGETQLDYAVRIWRRSFSIGMQIVLHLAVKHYTDDRLMEVLPPDGAQRILAIRASELPHLKVHVTASPSLRRVDAEQLQLLIQWFQLPDPLKRVAARYMNLPAEDVQEVMQAQQQMMLSAAGAGPGAPPGGPAGSPRSPVPGAQPSTVGGPAQPPNGAPPPAINPVARAMVERLIASTARRR